MTFPKPVPGLVIRYSFLWREEDMRGMEEGSKDRPCAIILTTEDDEVGTLVTVLPVTHSPPSDKSLSIEIPPATKKRLGLDDDRSWIVLTDANRFVWPGPDLRYIRPGDATSASYGLLPDGLYLEVRNKFVAAVRANRAKAVTRTE